MVARTPATRRVLVFDGDGERWLPPGFELIPQRGDGLAERLAAAFEDVGEPALLVGMDTPQLTPELLRRGDRALRATRTSTRCSGRPRRRLLERRPEAARARACSTECR